MSDNTEQTQPKAESNSYLFESLAEVIDDHVGEYGLTNDQIIATLNELVAYYS